MGSRVLRILSGRLLECESGGPQLFSYRSSGGPLLELDCDLRVAPQRRHLATPNARFTHVTIGNRERHQDATRQEISSHVCVLHYWHTRASRCERASAAL